MNGKTEGTGLGQYEQKLTDNELLERIAELQKRQAERAVPLPYPYKTEPLPRGISFPVFNPPPPTPLLSPVAEQALVNIGDGMRAIATFLGGATLPQVIESAALLGSLGQILGGLTSHAGRQGLDARVIQQDAIDSTHKVISLFDKLKETLEAKRNGEFREQVNAEADFEKWVREQEDAGRPNKANGQPR